MHYCGVAVANSGHLQLATLQEVREPEPPIRLLSAFYEPGDADQVAAELHALQDVVVAVAAPMGGPLQGRERRRSDELLAARGVPPAPAAPEAMRLFELLADMGLFAPDATAEEGSVDEGAYHQAPVFETSADGIFCALQARRLPAKRHPFGMQLRIHELEEDHVVDDGGGLWQRRIEEVDAAGAALCAHRYAVGHACWLGNPAEGVTVLPGSTAPERFSTEGVLNAVERVLLPRA